MNGSSCLSCFTENSLACTENQLVFCGRSMFVKLLDQKGIVQLAHSAVQTITKQNNKTLHFVYKQENSTFMKTFSFYLHFFYWLRFLARLSLMKLCTDMRICTLLVSVHCPTVAGSWSYHISFEAVNS